MERESDDEGEDFDEVVEDGAGDGEHVEEHDYEGADDFEAAGEQREALFARGPGTHFAIGKEHRRHRKLVYNADIGDERWVSCAEGDYGTSADNIIHLYDRVVGFTESEQDRMEMEATAAVRRSAHEFRSGMKFWSHWQRVTRFALFVRWVKAECPDSPYTAFLARLDARVEALQRGEHWPTLAFEVLRLL